MKQKCDISIVTPSFNQPRWLNLCLASVADQQGVAVEHIVQDNETPGGLDNSQGAFPDVRFFVEKDEGMYDAVNRGLKKATGEICAYLNCDEQYLPGVLSTVVTFFANNPQVDVLFGDVVVVDSNGGYICTRQVLKPLYYHTKTCHLNTFTAAMFFRRSILEQYHLFFDPTWRNIGDVEWMLRAIKSGIRMAVWHENMAVFADTGSNLNMQDSAGDEYQRLRRSPPRWPHYLAGLWASHHRLRRAVNGFYKPKPLSFSLYTITSPHKRVTRVVKKPECLWKDRLKNNLRGL